MSKKPSAVQVQPFIPASSKLPEITVKAVVLGIILAVVLAASSTFAGLKIARTISGSIPAALISMLVLRRFKKSNILENNMVQTIASAGETVASGAIFTLPALIIMGYWQSFNYFQVAIITVIGGSLGVLFSIPIRSSMLVKEPLPYPEGVATGEVLKAGESTEGSTKLLLIASLFSAVVSFLQIGLKVAGEQVQYWTKVGSTAMGANLFLSPILMAAGYIVGSRGLVAFTVAGLLTWGLAIPIFVASQGLPEAADIAASLSMIHKSHFKYVGIGIFAVGGLWSVISLMQQIASALRLSFASMKNHNDIYANTPRTERDIPFKYVLIGTGIIALLTTAFFIQWLLQADLGLSTGIACMLITFTLIAVLVLSFMAAAAAAYIVGMVGTTSLPSSGITISSIIVFSTGLLGILCSVDFVGQPALALKIAALVIMFAAIVCIAAALSGDNMQDLKAGQLVGATPWKQQLMLLVGAIASALVIPFILQTTFEAYGISDIMPRVGMDPAQALPAPQATLMAAVAQSFFVGRLPMQMILGGCCVGVIAIIIDVFLQRRGSESRFSPLLFAAGVYLPFGYVMGFVVGGVLRALAKRGVPKKAGVSEDSDAGVLCASGIIAGEAILGALLTIPFAYYQTTDVFALKFHWLTPNVETGFGLVLYAGIGLFLYKQAKR